MKLIVIGDAFIDKYHVGTSHRLSPEAPIPVVGVDYVVEKSGGAANVRENLRSLGEEGLILMPPI